MSQQYIEHLKVLLSLYFVVHCKLLTFQLNSLRVLEGLCCFFVVFFCHFYTQSLRFIAKI